MEKGEKVKILALTCLIVGEGSVFGVEIEDNKPVWMLKEVINHKKELVEKRNADKLELYLAKQHGNKDGKWMTKTDPDKKKLISGDEETVQKYLKDELLLDPEDGLDDYFTEKPPKKGQIHVLVKLPNSPGNNEQLETVRQETSFPRMNALFDLVYNPQQLVLYRNALVNDCTNVVEHSVVKLPDSVNILGEQLFGSSIYIRPCYLGLLRTVLEILKTIPHLVILGNPGIGKTYFGYFMLYYLIHNDATAEIIYEHGKTSTCYFLSRNLVAIGRRNDFGTYLRKSSTYYIVDACTPHFCIAKTILITSPRRSVWYEYSKSHCTLRYMPVWDENEVLNCRRLMYSHLPEQVVETRFLQWGGIARYVLQYAMDSVQQEQLTAALDAAKLQFLINAFGRADQDDVSHRLIHMSVNNDFTADSYCFASDYVMGETYRRLYEEERTKLVQFIAVSGNIGQVGVLRGILFEQYAHDIISRGGDFRIRPLDVDDDNTTPTILKVPKSEVFVFENDEDVSVNEDCYFRPRSQNYESVDAFIKPEMLFQMTGARMHPLKQSGLHKVLTLLGNPENPRVYFVLPPERYEDFKYQKYQDVNGKAMESATYKNVQAIKQYALKINLISRTSSMLGKRSNEEETKQGK